MGDGSIQARVEDGICELRLSHENPKNPFSRAMTQRLITLAPELNADAAVKAVVLWGGADRSFSVGGDFRDIAALKTHSEMRAYLLEIIDLYIAILRIDKPVVAAIDHHAIGQGLQVALCADWRVASGGTVVAMPELQNGVACPLGSLMLEVLLGRARMMHAVVGCASFDAESAKDFGLVDQVDNEVFATALKQAKRFAGFHATPFSLTKHIHNARFIAQLDAIREPAAEAHVQSFSARANVPHFEKVIGPLDG